MHCSQGRKRRKGKFRSEDEHFDAETDRHQKRKKKTSSIENFGRPPPTGERKKTEKVRDRNIARKSRSNVPPSDLSSFADPLFARANTFRAHFSPKTVPTNSGSPVLLAFFEVRAKKQIRLFRKKRTQRYVPRQIRHIHRRVSSDSGAGPTDARRRCARARVFEQSKRAIARHFLSSRERVRSSLPPFSRAFSFSLSLSKGKKEGKKKARENPKPTQRDGKREREREKGGIIRLRRRRASEER